MILHIADIEGLKIFLTVTYKDTEIFRGTKDTRFEMSIDSVQQVVIVIMK